MRWGGNWFWILASVLFAVAAISSYFTISKYYSRHFTIELEGHDPSSLSDYNIGLVSSLMPCRFDIAQEIVRRFPQDNSSLTLLLQQQACGEIAPDYHGIRISHLLGTLPTRPTSLAYDPLDGSFYISSAQDNCIIRGLQRDDGDIECTPFTVPEENGFGRPAALWLDDHNRLLWAVSNSPQALYSFSLLTGKPMSAFNFSRPANESRLSTLCPFGETGFLIRDELLLAYLHAERNAHSPIGYYGSFHPGSGAICYDSQFDRLYQSDSWQGLAYHNINDSGLIPFTTRERTFSSGISSLCLVKNELIGIHTAYGPTRVVRYQLDSSRIGIVSCTPMCIAAETLRFPVCAVSYRDTLFILTSRENPSAVVSQTQPPDTATILTLKL